MSATRSSWRAAITDAPRRQTPRARARGVWRSLRWWWRGVLGANAYEKYVARHRVEHPDHEPMTEREFWRRRQDAAPPKGCC